MFPVKERPGGFALAAITRSRKKKAMSTVINPSLEEQTSALFPIRLAAVAGLAAAVVLFVNAAKRAGVIPISGDAESSTELIMSQVARSSHSFEVMPCALAKVPVRIDAWPGAVCVIE